MMKYELYKEALCNHFVIGSGIGLGSATAGYVLHEVGSGLHLKSLLANLSSVSLKSQSVVPH